MEQVTRLRINLTTREFEIEGSEEFIKEYASKIEELFSFLIRHPSTVSIPITTPNDISQEIADAGGLPSTFGEYFQIFPRSITDVDKILIAGCYAQSQSPDKSFSTLSANRLLKEQGIKLTNAADCVGKNKKAKRVFVSQKGKYRVSQTGLGYLGDLQLKK